MLMSVNLISYQLSLRDHKGKRSGGQRASSHLQIFSPLMNFISIEEQTKYDIIVETAIRMHITH